MGILKSLYALVFFCLIFGVTLRISIAPQAYIYPLDLAVLIFVLYGYFLILLSKKKLNDFLPYVVFILVACLSLLVNLSWLTGKEFMISSLYLLRFIIIFSIFPIIGLLFKKKDNKFLLTVPAASLTTVSLLGLVQYFVYPDLRNLIYLGWDEHLYRVFSTFLDPNFASIIFIVNFWILLYLFSLYKPSKWLKVLLAFLVVLTFVTIMLTYSRTGYLAFAGSIVAYTVLQKKYKLLVSFIILIALSIFILPSGYVSEGVNLLRTSTIFSRLDAFGTAFRIFLDHPLLGVGFNAYRYAQSGVGIATSHAGSGVSNSYLFVLATTGIVGFAAFMYMIFRMFRTLFNIRSNNRNLSYSLISILTVIIVGSLTENVFFYSFIMVIMFTVMGVAKVVKGDN